MMKPFLLQNIILWPSLIGSPLIVANFAMEQTVRSEGASRASMNGMFINTIASVILDPILILFFHLNVVGAAISMVLANGISLGYYALAYSKKERESFNFLGTFLK